MMHYNTFLMLRFYLQEILIKPELGSGVIVRNADGVQNCNFGKCIGIFEL
jgi:hypothetical protein